jgi:hypothetical protein
MPFAAMGLRGPMLKETWGHVALAGGAVMDFVGGGMWRFLGVAQKDPFSLYYSQHLGMVLFYVAAHIGFAVLKTDRWRGTCTSPSLRPWWQVLPM